MHREIVLEAFRQRLQWRVTCVDSAALLAAGDPLEEDRCAPAPASSSLLHWGEYERIDWEQVHAGAEPPCLRAPVSPSPPADCTNFSFLPQTVCIAARARLLSTAAVQPYVSNRRAGRW